MLSHLTTAQIETIINAVAAIGVLAGAIATYLNRKAAAGHAAESAVNVATSAANVVASAKNADVSAENADASADHADRAEKAAR